MTDTTTALRIVCGHDSRSVVGCLHCEAADLINQLRAAIKQQRAAAPAGEPTEEMMRYAADVAAVATRRAIESKTEALKYLMAINPTALHNAASYYVRRAIEVLAGEALAAPAPDAPSADTLNRITAGIENYARHHPPLASTEALREITGDGTGEALPPIIEEEGLNSPMRTCEAKPLKAANLSAALRAIVRECHGAATRSSSPLAIPGQNRPYSSDSYLPPHLLDLAVAALESAETQEHETPLQVIEAMRREDIERAPSYEELRELHREKRL